MIRFYINKKVFIIVYILDIININNKLINKATRQHHLFKLSVSLTSPTRCNAAVSFF